MRGFRYYIKEIFFRSFKYLLVHLMSAPKWHIATTYNKDYSKSVIDYLNKLPSRECCIAEIGCGTCDILRSVKQCEKFGYDSDDRVLVVANILNTILFDKIKLYQYDFLDPNIFKWNFDVVILLNWTHEIESSVLKERINEICSSINVGGKIIIDMVKDISYKYNHNIDDAFYNNKIIKKKIFSNSIRDIYVVSLDV